MFCPPPELRRALPLLHFSTKWHSPPCRRAVSASAWGKVFNGRRGPGDRPRPRPSSGARCAPAGPEVAIWTPASRRRGRAGPVRSDLCRARSRHQQLPAAGGARDPRQLPRGRRVLAHHPARRRRHRVRPAERGGDRARGRCAAGLPQQDPQPRRHPGAADRDRSLPRRRERQRIPGAGARGGRHRARNRRPRDRSAAGGDRLHAAGRSGVEGRDPVRHRRRLIGTGAARPHGADRARPAASGGRSLGVAADGRRDAGRAPRRRHRHAAKASRR